MFKKRFGLKRVVENGVFKYRAKWWLRYLPTWLGRIIIKKIEGIDIY